MMAAAIYNFVWGGLVVLFPFLLFDALGLERPIYPQIWQCVGMIVGVYGVGYWIASRDPIHWWPLVLVGLLGKIFGPIGFVWAIAFEGFPAAFGWTILTNDLIWWVPFTAILLAAWHHYSRPRPMNMPKKDEQPAQS